MRFGISTYLYRGERLRREHLLEIADHGFDAIELYAVRDHFDYRDEAAVGALVEWLRDTGLVLHGIHRPGDPGLGSTASATPACRERALDEIQAALQVAQRIATGVLVVHLGIPTEQATRAGDNQRDMARRSLEQVGAWAAPLDVRVAVEVLGNDLSTPLSLVQMLENELELPTAGICLDFGQVSLAGDLVDAVENLAGHLITTHVHDTDGRVDRHLVPFEGVIDWPAALMAVQKIGYDGRLLMDLGPAAPPPRVLENARRARATFERLLAA